jgi:PIN domain nuclease of toxin-antitoxin system
MRRIITAGTVLAVLLAAGAMANIVFNRPEKPAMQKYRIGEQGLAEEEALKEEGLQQTVVGRIADYELTAAEVEKALKLLPPFQRYYYSSPEKLRIFLQNYAMLLLLAREALGRGLDQDPYVRFVVEEKLAERYRQAWLADAVKPSAITDEDVEAWLEQHPETGAAGDKVERSEQDLVTAAKAAILEERRAAAWARHLEELNAP